MNRTDSVPPGRGWAWVAVSAAGVLGSLALSLALGLKACPLCFYQRAFALMACAALTLGAFASDGGARWMAGRVAFTAAVAGLVVAGFHVYLEVSGTLECPSGLLGLGTAPQQSAAFFVVLAVGLGTRLLPAGGRALVAPLVLAALLGVASLSANPPMPPAPGKAYPDAPSICRPPFRQP